MAKVLNKYNLDAKEVGKVNIADSLHDATAPSQMVKDYIVALRANTRQWSANTKGRSEVNHSTKKPHPQKGGGRSRQGSLAAPHYKGGGRVFGPKPKFDQHVRINHKEKRLAISFLMGEKIREGRLIVVDSFDMKEPKTKRLFDFLKSTSQGARPLFLGEAEVKHNNLKLSLRNIPNAEFRLVRDASGYDLMIAHDIVITESALNEFSGFQISKEAK